MRKGKKYLALAAVFVLLTALACAILLDGQEGNKIQLDREQSWFSDFDIEGDMVKVHCHLVFHNPSRTARTFSITGFSPEDHQSGLLQSEQLRCVSLDENADAFAFASGQEELSLDVIFLGKHGAGEQKQSRLLPETIIVRDSETGEEYPQS